MVGNGLQRLSQPGTAWASLDRLVCSHTHLLFASQRHSRLLWEILVPGTG
jgi:hypothetical protein